MKEELRAWVERGVALRTAQRWQADGAPVGKPDAMLDWWRANRRNRPPTAILEAAGGDVVAAAAPVNPAGKDAAPAEPIDLATDAGDLSDLSENLRRWIASCRMQMQRHAAAGNLQMVSKWRREQREATEEWRKLAKELPRIMVEEGRALDREETMEAVARICGQMLAGLRAIPRRLNMAPEMGRAYQAELDRLFDAWHEAGLSAA